MDLREVGFATARRFLQMIGTGNIRCLRHVAFLLTDAVPSINWALEAEKRRFVYDEDLFSIMRRLSGARTQLRTLYLNFHGRRRLIASRPQDARFLEAFAGIRADDVRLEKWHVSGGCWAWLGKSRQDDAATEMILTRCRRKERRFCYAPHISPSEAIIPEHIRNIQRD